MTPGCSHPVNGSESQAWPICSCPHRTEHTWVRRRQQGHRTSLMMSLLWIADNLLSPCGSRCTRWKPSRTSSQICTREEADTNEDEDGLASQPTGVHARSREVTELPTRPVAPRPLPAAFPGEAGGVSWLNPSEPIPSSHVLPHIVKPDRASSLQESPDLQIFTFHWHLPRRPSLGTTHRVTLGALNSRRFF